MASPKVRISKSRKRMRRAANRWHAPKLHVCPECGSAKQGHTACPSCGYYKDRQVISVDI